MSRTMRGTGSRAAAVLVLAATLAACSGPDRDDVDRAASDASPGALPDRSATADEQREAVEVAAALDQLPRAPGKVLAEGARALTGDLGEAVPPGSTVVSDPASWAPDGVGGGTMEVSLTPPSGASTTYLAVVVQEEGDWKVLMTLPVSSPGRPS